MKKILIGILVLAAVLFFGRNVIAKLVIEKGTEAVTGLPLEMGKLDLNFDKTFIEIADLKLSNPKGFEDSDMLLMPEILVDYDLATLLKGKVHLEKLTINLEKFVVVRNSKGKLNLDSLRAVQKSKKQAAKKKKAGPAPQANIDKLSLKIGRVIFKDYSKGGEPEVKYFNINLNESYSNVTDLNAVVSLIVVKALQKTTISTLTNFDVTDLEGSLTNAVGVSKQLVSGLASQTQTSEGAKGTLQELSGAAQSLKTKLFGGSEDNSGS